jgi:hypothetical protein
MLATDSSTSTVCQGAVRMRPGDSTVADRLLLSGRIKVLALQ